MAMGTVGMWFALNAMTPPESIECAQKIENLAYTTLRIPEGFGREPFPHAAQLLAHTKRLVIATGIANIWARDPITRAAATNNVAEAPGARFILAIGASNKPHVEDLRRANNEAHSYVKTS